MATRASARFVHSALSKNGRFLPRASQIAARTNVADTCFAQCRGKSTSSRGGQLTKQLVLHTKVVHSLQDVKPYSTVLQAKVQDEAISADDEQDLGDFNRLGISDTVQARLRARGIDYLFPVQYKAYKESLAGNDMIIQARTGTGKTLSFAIPLVEKLLSQNISKLKGRKPKVIVMTPTRELASQINQDFFDLSDELSIVKLLGGTPYHLQYRALAEGCDIVVGTPGRIMDMCQKQSLDLSDIQHVVLDEVDHMLDIGFKEQVDKIIQNLYKKELKPQTMMYSATISDWVLDSGRKYLRNKYTFLNFVENRSAKTATTIEQFSLECPEFEQHAKVLHLVNHFSGLNGKAIVFTETKREADILSRRLGRSAESLHGDKRQFERERILSGFKGNRFRILIATSVAARGLDIPDVPLVIQLGPPNNKDHYIHRVGRTGRAGKSGVAILLYDRSQIQDLRQMEKAANLRFKNLSLPPKSGVSEVSLSDAIKKLDEVPQELINKYKQAARQYVDQKGAIEGMAAALVALGGISKMASSSLLTGMGGFTTVQYNSSEPKSERAIKVELQDAFESGNFNNIQQVNGKNAFVFDVKSDQVKDFIQKMEEVNDEKCVEVLDELPSLVRDITGRDDMYSSDRFNGGRTNRDGPSINRDRLREDSSRFGDSRGSYRQRGNFAGNRDTYPRRKHTFGDMVFEGNSNNSSRFDEGRSSSNSRFRGNDSNRREFTQRPKKYDMDDYED